MMTRPEDLPVTITGWANLIGQLEKIASDCASRDAAELAACEAIRAIVADRSRTLRRREQRRTPSPGGLGPWAS